MKKAMVVHDLFVQDGGEGQHPVEGDDEEGAGVGRVRGVREDTRPQPRLP